MDLPINPTGYQEIRIDQVPTQIRWCLTPLYKDNAIGNTQVWQVCFDGISQIEMSYGVVGGKIRTNRTEVDLRGNNTMQEQALIRAHRRYMDKFTKEGYRPPGAALPTDPEPALAYEWVSHSKMQRARDLVAHWKTNPASVTEQERIDAEVARGNRTNPRTKVKEEVWSLDAKWKVIERDPRTLQYQRPVAVQPKLDGGRLVMKLSGDIVVGRTRGEKVRDHPEYLPEIRNNLLDFFAYLPAGTQIDGEIWSPHLKFEVLMGVFKTETHRHPQADKVKYYIFDLLLPQDFPYEDRYVILMNAFTRFIQSGGTNPYFEVLTFTLANNDSEVESLHDQFVELKYEGAMIRKLSRPNQDAKSIKESLYHPGRSANLLKYKKFEDEEGIVVAVEEAKGTEVGAADLVIRDKRGNIFPVRMRGPVDERRAWLQNPALVMGKEVTYTHQPPLTAYGVPRFPIGKAIRDYE